MVEALLHVGRLGHLASALLEWHSKQTSALTMMHHHIDIGGVAVLAHGDPTGDWGSQSLGLQVTS